MKWIIVYLPPEHVDRVLRALADRNVRGLSVSEVRGFGQEWDLRQPSQRVPLAVEMKRRARLEIFTHAEEAAGIVDTIYAVAHTGVSGDGKIFVVDVADALRIKTGERGRAALGPPSEK